MTADVHETVRRHYAEAALSVDFGVSCCGDSEDYGGELYSALERAELPSKAVMASLGCGNPTAVADLHEGDRVLDLGSGGGIDVLLSAKRDAEAAKRFFRKALAQPHTVNPRTITVDKNAAYPKAVVEMKKDGELWRRSRLRQVKYLNNILEQDLNAHGNGPTFAHGK